MSSDSAVIVQTYWAQSFLLLQLCMPVQSCPAADFSDVSLRDARLTNANLHGSNLRGADLTGTNLRGAI